MNNDARTTLANGCAELSIAVTDAQLDQFMTLCDMLIDGSKRMNLTAITNPNGIVILHFLDSLSLLNVCDFQASGRVLDIGTGAGFPGLPLLIMNPNCRMTMVDSTQKKLRFIETVLKKLNLNGSVLHSRAEILGQDPAYREKYSLVVSRAVAPLDVLAEYCLPLVEVGGTFLAQKGPKLDEELDGSMNAIEILGGVLEKVYSFTLPDGSDRRIAKIEKVHNTPPQYPRHGGKIRKKPLT